jgi:hypothetical protein
VNLSFIPEKPFHGAADCGLGSRTVDIGYTRLTVYDILDYLQAGWHHTAIATLYRISTEQVLATVRYIEEHEEEVMAQYRRMKERDAHGKPPEIRAKLEASHAKLQDLIEQRRQSKEQGNGHAGHPGGHQQ